MKEGYVSGEGVGGRQVYRVVGGGMHWRLCAENLLICPGCDVPLLWCM